MPKKIEQSSQLQLPNIQDRERLPSKDSTTDYDSSSSSAAGVKRIYDHITFIQYTDDDAEKLLFQFRPRRPEQWSYFTFYTIQILDKDLGPTSFSTYYYKHVYENIPGLPKPFLNDRMTDVPLYLLHSIFALCLVLPGNNPEGFKSVAYVHFQYASKLVQIDLENANPWTICTLLHLSIFAWIAQLKQASLANLSLATILSSLMGISNDTEVIWKSPIGTPLQMINFQRSMYMNLYRIDFFTSILLQKSPMISNSIPDSFYSGFQLPQVDGLALNNLTFAKYNFPLLSISREILVEQSIHVNISHQYALYKLAQLKSWWLTVPSNFKYHPQDPYRGRFVTYIPLHYYCISLLLLRCPFLELVDLIQSGYQLQIEKEPVIEELIIAIRQISIIASSFCTDKTALLDANPIVKFFFTYASHFCLPLQQVSRLSFDEEFRVITNAIVKCCDQGPDFDRETYHANHTLSVHMAALRENRFKWPTH